MADGQAQLFCLGRIGRCRSNELSVLDRIDEETTENFGAVRRADDGRIGSKQEDPSHATVQGSATSLSDGAIARLLAAAPRGEDLSMLQQRIASEDSSGRLGGTERPGKPAALSSPHPLEQQENSNVDVVAEARRFGLDSDFLASLPREIALEILDEARRENELLGYHGSDIEPNIDTSRHSLSASSTREGPNPATEEETLRLPVDNDRVANNFASLLLNGRDIAVGVLADNDVPYQNSEDHFPPEEAGSFAESHRSSSFPHQLSSGHQEDNFAREDVVSLRHTMGAARSYSQAMPSTLNPREQQSARSEVVSHNSALPSQSSRRISHNNRRRKSSMMRVAICSLVQRDAQRVSELSRLYSLAYNEGWSMKN